MDATLKQRLVGASVIIALAVIFIPMIFNDSNRNQNQSITIDIPEEPSELQQKLISIDKKYQTTNINKENTRDVAQEQQTNPEPVIETQETIIDFVDNSEPETTKKAQQQVQIVKDKTKEVKELVVKQEKPKEVKVKTPKVSKPKPTKPIKEKEPAVVNDEGNYRLKFGVFSQQKNAQQIKAKIIHNGIQAIVEKDAATGMYKVYSNQYTRRASVEQIQKKIAKLKLNIGKTSIEKLDKKASDDAQQLLDTGWIVQIGIFSNQENSVKLRNKIRAKGYICFVDEILNDKNQKLYRVRVGPYAEHSEAEGNKKNLKKNMNLQGLIKPHEKQRVVN